MSDGGRLGRLLNTLASEGRALGGVGVLATVTAEEASYGVSRLSCRQPGDAERVLSM